MSVWQDPLVPPIAIPPELLSRETNTKWYKLGSARYQLLPKQYEFLHAKEEFVGFISGYGGGKTRVGSIKAAQHSMIPGNRGVVGRLAGTDLEKTAERDLLDFLHEAELLKQPPNARDRTALVHCVDMETGKNLGTHSEVEFIHLDDPKHLRGRHIGWGWIDEGSEVHPSAWQNLIGRLRLPEARGLYTMFVTGNPEGHNWIYDFFFNREILETMTCGGKPGVHVSGRCPDFDNVKCNARLRKKRRAIHCTSFENYFLPAETLDAQMYSFSEEDRQRYLEASFDVFEGQLHKEFRHDIHVIRPPAEWINGAPPKDWPRLLAVDVGGASPWAFTWAAVDPENNVVVYDEIYLVTSDVEKLAQLALPKMVDEDKTAYKFRAKVIDYENKIAAEDLRRRGIHFTNAQKHGKAGSIARFSSYLHPNPKHHFPDYHPRSGQPNSPRWFFTTNCPNVIREIPQQRWKEDRLNERLKDEADRSIPNHGWDTCLYISRELPEVTKLKPTPSRLPANFDLRSALYWEDVRRAEEQTSSVMARRPYRIRPIGIDALN